MRQEQLDKLWAAIQNADISPLSTAEKDYVSQVLSSRVMRRVLARVLCEVNVIGGAMVSTPLTSQEGIFQAVRNQGQAAGITRAVEIICAQALDADAEDSDNAQAQ